MPNRPKASGKTAFGVPLRLLNISLTYMSEASKESQSIRMHRNTAQRITFGDRGCNFGGSGLRPLRFADGRLRNRAEPKLYRQDGSRKER